LRSEPTAVVANTQSQLCGDRRQFHFDATGITVFHGVANGFLCDPVECEAAKIRIGITESRPASWFARMSGAI